jgi:hypothetical protein
MIDVSGHATACVHSRMHEVAVDLGEPAVR